MIICISRHQQFSSNYERPTSAVLVQYLHIKDIIVIQTLIRYYQ